MSGQRHPISFVFPARFLGRFRIRPVSRSASPFGFASRTGQQRSTSFLRRLPYKSSPRPISTGPLHPLQGFHSQPIYLVVFEGPYCFHMRNFISGWVSRLDAFSVYPVRTQLPGSTAGAITGTPSVRPLRSSRTKSRSLHVSYARDGYGPNCLTTF